MLGHQFFATLGHAGTKRVGFLVRHLQMPTLKQHDNASCYKVTLFQSDLSTTFKRLKFFRKFIANSSVVSKSYAPIRGSNATSAVKSADLPAT